MLVKGLLITGSVTTFLIMSGAANAQRINTDVKEKSHWYNAPREVQIIDNRPVVRDFREPDQKPGQIELPSGPPAVDGSTIPSGGLPLGGGAGSKGYRTPVDPLGDLPNARGFGGTNIPARGVGPRGVLPNGTSSRSAIGKLLTPQTPSGAYAGPIKGISKPSGHTLGNTTAPSIASYGGYGTGNGSGVGASSSRTEASVHGVLKRGSLLQH